MGGDSRGILGLGLLVVLAATGLSERIHAVHLVLGTDAAEVVHLADGTVHRLLKLFQREAQETIATHDLCILLHLGLGFSIHLCLVLVFLDVLPLGDADEHALLGLVERENGGTLTTLDGVDDLLGGCCVKAEDTT